MIILILLLLPGIFAISMILFFTLYPVLQYYMSPSWDSIKKEINSDNKIEKERGHRRKYWLATDYGLNPNWFN